MIKPPHAKTNIHKIASLIFQHGGMTLDQGIERHGVINGSRYKTKCLYEDAVDKGWLIEQRCIYALTKELHDYFLLSQPVVKKAGAITPGRLVSMWTPEMSIDPAQRRKFGAA